MASFASDSLVLCNDGHGARFRSLDAAHAFLGIAPPYDTCLAYAPYARYAPHCSRPVNRRRAASVAGLLHRLLRLRIPSMEAGVLLKTLSTHAVCGITGWHQNKAGEVDLKWLHKLWKEYLRANGLDPQFWDREVPSMLEWNYSLDIARQEQEDDTEDDEDEYDNDDEHNDDDDNDDDDDDESLSGESVTYSDAESLDFDDEDSSVFDDGESSSGEFVATPDTTISDFDQDISDEYQFISSESASSRGEPLQSSHPPDDSQGLSNDGSVSGAPTTAQQSSAGDGLPSHHDSASPAASLSDFDDQDESGNPETDGFNTDLLALGDDIFLESDATSDSTSSSSGSPVPVSVSARAGFRLYPQAPSPVSQLKQLLNLMTQTVSHQRRYTGIIYAFTRPSAPGMLKIGVVKDTVVAGRPFADPVDHRLATWQAQCGHPVTEVFRRHITCAAAERIESLIHLALRQYRRIEDPPCRRCERRKRTARARNGGRRGGGRHDEWFEIDTQTALDVVDLWASFAGQLPYDRFGKLLDYWSEKIEETISRLGPEDRVEDWQEMIPQLIEERTRTDLAAIVGRLYI